MIYIRADANRKIATGHVMRCLSIADALKKMGETVVFITADLNSRELIEKRGYSIFCLNSKWDDLDRELKKLTELICEFHIPFILIDSYYVTSHYLNVLRTYTKVAYIDDLHEFYYPCDLLICYALYAEQLNFQDYPSSTTILSGCKYVPLRKCFQNLEKKKVNEVVKEVLITTGGSDNDNFAGRLLNCLLACKRLSEKKYYVITGIYNQNMDLLLEMEKLHPNIHIKNQVNDMVVYMSKADIAISAGGSTLYELCAVGIPTICYTFVDNQLENAEAFCKHGFGYYVGDIRNTDVIENIYQSFLEMESNILKRQNFSYAMQDMIDGMGADRIAIEVINCYKT